MRQGHETRTTSKGRLLGRDQLTRWNIVWPRVALGQAALGGAASTGVETVAVRRCFSPTASTRSRPWGAFSLTPASSGPKLPQRDKTSGALTDPPQLCSANAARGTRA